MKFRAGELDGLDDVKPENYRWYEDNQQKDNSRCTDLGPDTEHRIFLVQPEQGPAAAPREKLPPGKRVGDRVVDPVKYSWFSNPVFRRAVSMAIDRDAMIRSVFFGEATKNWALAGPSNKEWHSPDLPHYDYNPAESKRLLASIGFKDGNGDGSSRTRAAIQ